jgi:hypothetical protein
VPEEVADDALDELGVVLLRDFFAHVEDAWRAAETVVAARVTADERVEVIGDYVLPAPGGPASRDFQTLHFDFGLPLVPAAPTDVARLTALHVRADGPDTEALTRLVPLDALLAARGWPDRDELIRRWTAYGVSHGAWAGSTGYVEGSLARIVEAAVGDEPELPSVKAGGGFLCGTEFQTLDDEDRFLSERGLSAGSAAVEICLHPGDLLVFDNLTVAHGRRGRRRPGELHQRVFGHRRASVARQNMIRERILAAFADGGREENRVSAGPGSACA